MPTKIEWAEETWSPITGCSPVSEGCAHCYAQRMAQRLKGRFGYPADEPFRVTFHPNRLDQPLKWEKPRHIFVCSMGDLFHGDVRFEWIRKVLVETIAAPQHTYFFLTKRPERMHDIFIYFSDVLQKNIYLGVTAENQQRADERIPILLQIPAAKRFVSIEPMLGPMDLDETCSGDRFNSGWCWRSDLDWVILGGESGPGARPMHPDWVRSVRDQCQAVGVPFFFKQWGEWIPKLFYWPKSAKYIKGWGTLDIDGNWFPETTPWNGRQGEDSETKEYVMYRVGKKQAGRLLDGREWNEKP